MKRALFTTLAAVLLLCSLRWPAWAAEYLHHDLEVTLKPQEGRLEVRDLVTLPESLVNGTEQTLSFSLHGGLAPSSPDPSVTVTLTGSSSGFPPLETFEATLPAGLSVLILEYAGGLSHPLENVGEEYARGQRYTPGLIGPEGVYLSSGSSWYPRFSSEFITFSLEVTTPAKWDAVSQGRRAAHRKEESFTQAKWESPEPQDTIYLVAGPYIEYQRSAGMIQAMVFLREEDEALANRYLEATSQYLKMYESLLGTYPYPKFALVENFWETGFGMPSFTLLGPKVVRFPFILHSSYPHEILHNWWGNGVYIDYATGNWGEGLTAYLSDHLIKEQKAQGAEFRRNALQKYTDYVLSGRDMALSEFRSRHGSVTEAVGYGKSLMFFHMVRRHLGDDLFRRCLQEFYREFRFRTAGFEDLRRSFEETSGTSLKEFFIQWISRPGAPELALDDVGVDREEETSLLRFSLRQIQEGGDPFDMQVPLAVTLEGQDEAFMTSVHLKERRTDVELRLPSAPLRIDIDPEFDVFRRLNPREIPPALTRAFGAERALIILPSDADPSVAERYRELTRSLSRTGPGEAETVMDSSLEELPPDRSVWLLGWENRFFPAARAALESFDVSLGDRSVRLEKTELPREDHAFVIVGRHPADPDLALMWIGVDNLEAVPGLGRKLPHYHKYSYLSFEGPEPANVAKGLWPTTDSPLSIPFSTESVKTPSRATLPARDPMAHITPLFSEDEMIRTVTHLTSDELQGRAAGSPGLERAGRYIEEAFSRYGLLPGGDEENGYVQVWHRKSGGGELETSQNIIGLIPGNREDWSGQSVVVGAHFDHLGYGKEAAGGGEGEIHPGADDNASGVAVLLELARVLGKSWKPERTVIFAAFSGEEAGKLGSRFCVAQGGPFTAGSCLAMINLDTIGRLGNKKLMVLGGSSAAEWVHIFRGAGYLTGLEVEMVTENLDSSDHMSFQAAGIPAVQLFTGPHLDYHGPGDTADKIDPAGLVKIASLVKEALEYLAGREEPLTSNLSPLPSGAPLTGETPRRERKVRLGTIPDFSWSEEGVRLEGTVPGSPAEKAGLQEGDIVIAVAGKAVSALKDLSAILKSLSAGDRATVDFLRKGERRSVEALLEQR